MSHCVNLACWAILFSAVFACPVFAQPAAEPPATPASPGEGADVDALGSHVAIKMLLMNKEAIVLGEMAETKAQSKAVQTYARQMVAKHKELEKELKPLIDSAHLQSIKSIDTDIEYPRGEPGTQQQRADAETIRNNKWVLEGRPNPDSEATETPPKKLTKQQDDEVEEEVDVVQYQLAAVKNHIKSVVKRLEPLEGAQFDQAYLDQSIQAHAWMFAELGAMQTADQPKLQRLSDREKEMARQHLADARRLRDQLLRDRD